MKFLITLIFLTFYSSSSLSSEIVIGTSNAPPYMIKDSDSGIDIEITKTVLENMNYNVKLSYFSLTRALKQLKKKKVDVIVPIFTSVKDEGVYTSKPHVMYRPTAFSLKSMNLKIDNISDLGNYSIITFQGAKGYFGQKFIDAAERSPRYIEHFDMTKLVRMLISKRIDVVVLDYNIFKYYLKQMNFSSDKQKVKEHKIIPMVPAVVGFKNKQLRDHFNLELEKLYKSGEQKKIVEKYIK